MRDWMLSPPAALHLFQKLSDADHRPANRPAPNLLHIVAGGNAQRVEASIEGFKHRLSFDARADAACGPMHDLNRSSNCNLVTFAVGLKGVKRRRLHQPK